MWGLKVIVSLKNEWSLKIGWALKVSFGILGEFKGDC
jgi:hypothetical protein